MARWLVLIAITQQVSCGTGNSPPISRFDPNPTPAITVTVSPGSAQISVGASVQFLVTVQNASNPAVSWQVNSVPGGNSFVGTIAPSGAATASYTAPASVPATLTVTVTAVLQADATKSGSATVTVNPSAGPQITISPSNSSVAIGASVQFTATVQNGPQAVIWEVDGIQPGNSTIGTISPSGFYTAPSKIPNPAVVTIRAILSTDSSVSGSTTVTIVLPPVSLSISPSTGNVLSSGILQLSASVQNSTGGLTWEVNGVPGGNQSDGTISSTGIYTAIYSAPSVSSALTVSIAAVLQTNPPISASAGITVVPSNTLTGVYSWRNDNSLTGQNPQETTLTPSSVSGGQFGKLFSCSVDGATFAQPLYVANVTIPNLGTHNVVYVATEHDSVYAFDADSSSCQILWQVSFLNAVAGVTTVPSSDISGQTDIVPEIGITGTPVIDPATATLYVVSKTKINVGANPTYREQLHALDLTTGAEKFGGPATIQATVSGIGAGSTSGSISFAAMSLTENQRSALLLSGEKVYVAFDSYDDTDPFHGWLFAYNASDLTNPSAVFMPTPDGSNSHGGIGESGAAPSADTNGNIFVVTSDGDTFDPNTGDYPETLLKLQLSSAQPVADYFTPWNELTLNFSEKHFGSTGVLLLPDSSGGAVPLAVAGSEAGSLYLVNRNNLGGFNGPNGPDKVVQTLCVGAPLTGTPAYWVSDNTPTIYVAAAGDHLKALPFANGAFSSVPCPLPAGPSSQSGETFNTFGASPVVSSNGASSGIIWALDTSGYVTSSPAILHAYAATNLATELYTSPSSGTGAAGLAVKFAVPTVANGKVYIGTQAELSVFGLP